MRLSYVFFVAAATTLLASVTMATPSGRTAELSAMGTPGVAASNHVTGGEKRFLRYHGRGGEEEEEEEEDDDKDEEERKGGANLFASWKLDEMVEGIGRTKRFENWKAYGYNPVKLSKLGKLDGYQDLLTKYRTWFYHHSG